MPSAMKYTPDTEENSCLRDDGLQDRQNMFKIITEKIFHISIKVAKCLIGS
jgi:hypothetical protein